MSAVDPYAYDDAPFVLGLLGRDENLAFETHLLVCDECRARVEQLRDTAALLAELGPGDADAAWTEPTPVPDTSLPALLRKAGLVRRRRRTVLASAVAAVAAAVVALVVSLWPAPSRPSTVPQRLVAVTATPLTATARLTSVDGGTRISLACRYATSGYPAASGAYTLSVVDRNRHRHDLGSWTIRSGVVTRFSSAVAVPRNAIRQVLVTTPAHRTVLRLDV